MLGAFIGQTAIVVVAGTIIMLEILKHQRHSIQELTTEQPEGWEKQVVKMRYQNAGLIFLTGFIGMLTIIGLALLYKQ